MKLPRRTFLASGRGRCRAASHVAHRVGAELSDAACAHCLSSPGRPERYQRATHRPVVVGSFRSAIHCDNRPGASGNIAMELVVKSSPDGYTLTMIALSSAANATLFRTSLSISCATSRLSRASAATSSLWRCIPGSGQDRARADRLCQGQSEQAQYGIARKRNRAAHGERAVQIDDWRHHDPRALSRLRADGERPSRRSGAFRLRRHRLLDRPRQGRQAGALGVSTEARIDVLPDLPTVGEFVPGYEATGLEALAHRATRLSRSSTSLTGRSTRALPIRGSRRGSPTLATRRLLSPATNTASPSWKKPRNGAR